MYTLAICLLIVGIVLLALNILLFFNDYKAAIMVPSKKKMLYVNGIVLLFSLGVVILSTVYIFMIANQLN